jgi:hypothetical protein
MTTDHPIGIDFGGTGIKGASLVKPGLQTLSSCKPTGDSR